ncbi:mucin-5AC-like [Apodemus sylvaticus]|uniref:mucin-5AC-like n=1 Tax=Apodemus sylvaticus TaxID=10129 RepID=UPI002241D971|nr:mucin-5AC-like [Apodemus sylvaticus]
MTTKNIFPASKPMTGIPLQTSSEVRNPTTKPSKTNKSKRSILEMQDSVSTLSDELPENCDSSLSESTNFYHLGLRSLPPRKLLAPELQASAPIPRATKPSVSNDPTAMLQLTEEAYEFRKNLSPDPFPLMSAPTVSVVKAPSADTMVAPSADTMVAPSADTMVAPLSSVVKPPSSVTSKRLSAGATKPRTKTQDTNQREQGKGNRCFSLDLMFVNPNQSTLGIQHVSIPEATKVTIPGTHFTS